jgi:LysM repeat protein
MQRRGSVIFIILNMIVTGIVAFVVVNIFSGQNPQSSPIQVVTVEVRITTTPDANSTPRVVIVTATPLPGTPNSVNLPTDLLQTPGPNTTPLSTIDAGAVGLALEGDTTLQGTATALPENCILHVLASGDTPFGIAEQYGADGFAVMEINGLTDETASLLQIGDVLIVPLEGCPLTAADVATEVPTAEEGDPLSADATEESTAESTAEATIRPTVTLPPTAASAQVQIVQVVSPGDITAEGISIRNNGELIDLNGWTLTDSNGNTYTFSERLLFSNGAITLFTRTGQDTAIVAFWNRNSPIFTDPDNVLTLTNAAGVVQSTYRVPTSQDLP